MNYYGGRKALSWHFDANITITTLLRYCYNVLLTKRYYFDCYKMSEKLKHNLLVKGYR